MVTILELQITNEKVAKDLLKVSGEILDLMHTPWYRFRKRRELQNDINFYCWRVLVWAAYYGEEHKATG